MKANELRIGNWVKIKDTIFSDNLYDIYQTNEFQIKGFNDGSCLENSKVICFYEIPSKYTGRIFSGINDIDIEPIQLTEEWLLKFGFEWKGLISKGRYLTIFTPCGKALVFKDNYFIYAGITIEIQTQYVHQLQNLYFALTGEELTIKL